MKNDERQEASNINELIKRINLGAFDVVKQSLTLIKSNCVLIFFLMLFYYLIQFAVTYIILNLHYNDLGAVINKLVVSLQSPNDNQETNLVLYPFIIASLGGKIVTAPLLFGLSFIFLRLNLKQKMHFKDIFNGFSYLMVSLTLVFFTSLIESFSQVIPIIGSIINFYLMMVLSLSMFFLVTFKISPVEAIKYSIKGVNTNFMKVFSIYLINILICIGLFIVFSMVSSTNSYLFAILAILYFIFTVSLFISSQSIIFKEIINNNDLQETENSVLNQHNKKDDLFDA